MSENKIDLMANVAYAVPEKVLDEKLSKTQNRPLTIKLGFDPTAPDLHLGHAVVLRKLRDFQRAGHKIVVVIGDFTAQIGDPTGRNQARPPLSEEQVEANANTYINQLGKVLDVSKIEVRRNSEWLNRLTPRDIVSLMSKVTVSHMLSRDDFKNRIQEQVPISMHELLYPLMQGQDSLAIKADVELGGTDQLFNCMMGRALQEASNLPAQAVMTMPLLIGTDGVEKMSKSKGNYIGLLDPAEEMYGKCMSIPDSLIENYIDLATDINVEEAYELKSGLVDGTAHPMEVKKTIAHNIVTIYHGTAEANHAADYFYRNVQDRSSASKDYVERSLGELSSASKVISALDLCIFLESKHSKNEIRRLVQAGAISIDDQKIEDPNLELSTNGDDLRVRIGKRGFYCVKRNPENTDPIQATRILSWIRQTSEEGGIERYDDLHVDMIDPTWKPREHWIYAGLVSLVTAGKLKQEVPGAFSIVLAIRLDQERWHRDTVDGATEQELTKALSWTPPSLYLFRPKQEFWRETASEKTEPRIREIGLNLSSFPTREYRIDERRYTSRENTENSLDLFITR